MGDFITLCTRFDASKRMSVHDALNHQLFHNSPYQKMKRPQITLDPERFCFDFEQQELDERALKDIIVEEVHDFVTKEGGFLGESSSSNLCGFPVSTQKESQTREQQPVQTHEGPFAKTQHNQELDAKRYRSRYACQMAVSGGGGSTLAQQTHGNKHTE